MVTLEMMAVMLVSVVGLAGCDGRAPEGYLQRRNPNCHTILI